VKRVAVIVFSLAAMLAPAAAAQTQAAPAQADGRANFLRYCGGCHLERGFGTNALARRLAEGQAKLEDRPDLTAEYVRTAVRHGIGSMPAIRRSELDPTRLDGIAAYLGRGR
jgi:mono/diheme cytochrome c family protein